MLYEVITKIQISTGKADSSSMNFVKGITIFNTSKADSVLEFDYRINNDLKNNDSLKDIVKNYANHKFLAQIQHEVHSQ